MDIELLIYRNFENNKFIIVDLRLYKYIYFR